MLLIVGIPIAINEAYKTNTGYITVWGAEDVLSYYGDILGAGVTIGALAITILFTKRQIQRDSYIKVQEEKWNNIESHVSKALEEIQPVKVSEIMAEAISNQNGETITAIQLFVYRAKTSLDSLTGFISGEDYELLEPLLIGIADATTEYCGIAEKVAFQYQKMIQLQIRRNALDIKKTAQQNPSKFMKEIEESERILKETADLSEENVIAELNALGDSLVKARDNSFRKLLEQKRNTFAKLQKQRATEVDAILRLWR